MFYLIGISISFFLSALLFSKRKSSLADRILACWLGVVGVHLLLYYGGITGLLMEYPRWLGTHLPIPLLHGPFLFLYAAAQTGRLSRWGVKAMVHFIPAATDYGYLLHFFMKPAADKIWVYEHQGAGYEWYLFIHSMLILTSGVAYIVATWLLLRTHQKNILQEFSAIEKINLQWLRYLIYGISIIWLFVLLEQDNLVFGTAVLFVLFIGYFGIRQVGIFTHNHPEPIPVPNDPVVPESRALETETPVQEAEHSNSFQQKKYQKSGLGADAAFQLHEALKQLMITQKPYTHSELTLGELAERLNVHPNHLSQVINEKEGLNFYDYINTQRVEAFKQRIAQNGHQSYTLLALAFECGFNSKSTFNKYFRKVTGKTPSEYIKQTGNQAPSLPG